MRNRDDLCLIVNGARKKNTIVHYPCSGFVAHSMLSVLLFRLLSDSLLFCVSSQSSIRCPTREDQVVQHPLQTYGYLQQEE